MKKKNKKNRLDQIINKNVELLENLIIELKQIDKEKKQLALARVHHK
jgi:hypothetical protein